MDYLTKSEWLLKIYKSVPSFKLLPTVVHVTMYTLQYVVGCCTSRHKNYILQKLYFASNWGGSDEGYS